MMGTHGTDGIPVGPAPAIELDQVSLRYGSGSSSVQALAAVSFAVERGELVAVMGPSGSGKSTLVHIAAGLVAPMAGEVRVDGQPVGRRNRRRWAALRRHTIGVVFQRLNLVPTLTAVENVMVPLLLDGRPAREARTMAATALGDAGIFNADDVFPDDLSGGQQQRVAIARALVGARSVVLADEPTGALDTATSDEVVQLLARRAAAGAAVVMVTHESRVASWADRVVYLRDGCLTDGTLAASNRGPRP